MKDYSYLTDLNNIEDLPKDIQNSLINKLNLNTLFNRIWFLMNVISNPTSLIFIRIAYFRYFKVNFERSMISRALMDLSKQKKITSKGTGRYMIHVLKEKIPNHIFTYFEERKFEDHIADISKKVSDPKSLKKVESKDDENKEIFKINQKLPTKVKEQLVEIDLKFKGREKLGKEKSVCSKCKKDVKVAICIGCTAYICKKCAVICEPCKKDKFITILCSKTCKKLHDSMEH